MGKGTGFAVFAVAFGEKETRCSTIAICIPTGQARDGERWPMLIVTKLLGAVGTLGVSPAGIGRFHDWRIGRHEGLRERQEDSLWRPNSVTNLLANVRSGFETSLCAAETR